MRTFGFLEHHVHASCLKSFYNGFVGIVKEIIFTHRYPKQLELLVIAGDIKLEQKLRVCSAPLDFSTNAGWPFLSTFFLLSLEIMAPWPMKHNIP